METDSYLNDDLLPKSNSIKINLINGLIPLTLYTHPSFFKLSNVKFMLKFCPLKFLV